MEKSKIDRINELARKQKSVGLTEQEKSEQAKLRKEYLDAYHKSLESQLSNLVIQYPDGTKKKVIPREDSNIRQ